jgi:hypothetical protein
VSNTTGAEAADVNSLLQFNRNGFYIGSSAAVNTANNNYVAWAWKANGPGVTNTAGTITSTVSANTTAGFSVVTYTGNLSAAGSETVGHGLGVAPKMVISKSRNPVNGDTGHWPVQHTSLAANNVLFLTLTSAQSAVGGGLSTPTSSVFSAQYQTGLNVVGNNHVAYCFAEIPGFSRIGSYTGNGSTDGPFVWCGFRPRWVLIKRTDATADWVVFDTQRNPANLTNLGLIPSLPNAEFTGVGTVVDLLSNGFKARNFGLEVNVNAATYIFIAFAEQPFSAPSNAR